MHVARSDRAALPNISRSSCRRSGEAPIPSLFSTRVQRDSIRLTSLPLTCGEAPHACGAADEVRCARGAEAPGPPNGPPTREIADAVGLPVQAAMVIVDELERTFFGPYRTLIDQIYMPPGPIPEWSPYLMIARDRNAHNAIRRAYDLIRPVIAGLSPTRDPSELR